MSQYPYPGSDEGVDPTQSAQPGGSYGGAAQYQPTVQSSGSSPSHMAPPPPPPTYYPPQEPQTSGTFYPTGPQPVTQFGPPSMPGIQPQGGYAPPLQQSGNRTGLVITIVVLTVLILGGLGWGIWFVSAQSIAGNANATATALQKDLDRDATATANANVPTTIPTSGGTTPYGAGTLIYSDKLDSTSSHDWTGKDCNKTSSAVVVNDEGGDKGGTCYVEDVPLLSNFTIEVTMTMTEAGGTGAASGVGFRLNKDTGYYFYLNVSGKTHLGRYENGVQKYVWENKAASSAKTGTNQRNVIGIRGDSLRLYFYINGALHTIHSITSENLSTSGEFAFFSASSTDANGTKTSTSFTNLRIWR